MFPFGPSPADTTKALAPIDAEGLRTLVALNDVDAVRRYFDRHLADQDVTRPDWSHLLVAAERENTDMMRLLVTWGARPSRDELAAFRDRRGEKSAEDMQRLRLAGLKTIELGQLPPRIKVKPIVTETPAPVVLNPVEKIPQEWKGVLKSLKETAKAPEAVIAGGALRDLFNCRAIKDVDIFLKSPGNLKKSTDLLTAAFAKAGLEIHTQNISFKRDDGYGRTVEYTTATRVRMTEMKRGIFGEKQAFTVVAGPEKTEYNIIFMKGKLANDMRDAGKKKEKHKFAWPSSVGPDHALLNKFDIGLCQISYDGFYLYKTAAYENDVRDRSLTLTQPLETTAGHLKRVVTKYHDFTPDAQMKALLAPKPKASRSRDYYGSMYGRTRSMY